MPLFPFQNWKAAVITAMDIKTQQFHCCQTIRTMRKTPIKVGDRVHAYARSRQKDMLKLFDFPPLVTEVVPVAMDWKQGRIGVYVDGADLPLGESKLWDFAIADGFKDIDAFEEFFFDVLKDGDRVPFQLVKWTHVKPWSGSNGTDLDWWLSTYCQGCTKDQTGLGCKLVHRSVGLGEQPDAWYYHPRADTTTIEGLYDIVCEARTVPKDKARKSPSSSIYAKREAGGQLPIIFDEHYRLEQAGQLNLVTFLKTKTPA